MRIFALSDLHVDFEANARWAADLSRSDYQRDVLILAGDLSDSLEAVERCLEGLSRRFCQVCFVPGNHELWVTRDGRGGTSLDKFARLLQVAERGGATLRAVRVEQVSIVPLLGWYDYSFGLPGAELRQTWMDFHACRWPDGWSDADVTDWFIRQNAPPAPAAAPDEVTISFSHFLPRIDLMPAFIPPARRTIYPVLGSVRIEQLVRAIRPAIHVYGHSHVNRDIRIDGIRYLNNAFGYPYEERIASKALKCIYGTD
jgi:predicted phosphodiesterase